MAKERESRDKVVKSAEEWRESLSPEQFEVCRLNGTEPAFSGEYCDSKDPGVYRCRCCGEPLFDADHKFASGTGWPSFDRPAAAQAVFDEAKAEGLAKPDLLERLHLFYGRNRGAALDAEFVALLDTFLDGVR